MFNIILVATLIAFVIGNLVVFAAMLALMTNARFIKWWGKKYVKMLEGIQDEIDDLF